MSEKEKRNTDPFPQLVRRPLFVDMPREVIHVTSFPTIEMSEICDPTNFGVAPAKAAKIDELREKMAEAAKPKRGRPKTSTEPWKGAGVSKATWYRRQKEGK